MLFKLNWKLDVGCMPIELSTCLKVLVELLGFVAGDVLHKCECIELVASVEYLFVCSCSTFDE